VAPLTTSVGRDASDFSGRCSSSQRPLIEQHLDCNGTSVPRC
jgi:hypothetical protein